MIIVKHGDPLLDVMHRERLAMTDLMAAARENGVQRFAEIEKAAISARHLAIFA